MSLMITYDETTSNNHTSEPTIPFFALAGSFPEPAAKIYINHETINAIVTTVPIKNVAESIISCTNNPTEVASPSSLTVFLIPSVS